MVQLRGDDLFYGTIGLLSTELIKVWSIWTSGHLCSPLGSASH